ncbi:MAG: glutamate racemase [Patescibacteria group bacterium]|nr:glutamate racemase [Patescibacteria group bacterium]
MSKIKRNKSIGIFDSGFGGLDILKTIIRKFPEYNYVYLGDTARTPYGTRSKEVIYEFTSQAVKSLFENNCELIILACNTASSDALKTIQQEYLSKHYPDKKVLGVLIPTAEEAIKKTKNNRIGVIATEGTIRSNSFKKELEKLNSKVKVFQKACPLLVPIVEAGEQNSEFTKMVLNKYLEPLKKQNIDTLILGCTHYGILSKKIKDIMGNNVLVLSEAKIIPKKLENYLEKHSDIESKLGRNKKRIFYSSDLTDRFILLGSKFFGKTIKVEKISLK